MSAVAGPLNLVIDGVASTTANGSTTSTLTFTVYPAAVVCPGGVCNALTTLNQKTFYAAEYDAATRTFPRSFSFSGFTFQRLVDGGKGAQYTATKTAAAFAPEASASAFIYAYIATDPVIPPKGNYKLVDDVASAAKVYGTIDYTSAANVTGCEKCHVAPYSKHGYRQAHVTGLEDFVSCKACHTDQRAGGHRDWQLLVDDPATYAACSAAGTCATDAAHWADYAYTANVMNDTHMSHAMEFAYPQTIANCVACHAGNLAQVTSTANFKLATCKSCHPVTGVGGTDAKRAPALATILANASYNHAGIDLYTYPDSGAQTCAGCHPNKFAQVHGGFNTAVYAAEGSRYDAAVTTSIDSATFDSATNVVTATVSMTGLAANALVKPTVVVSLYGYDTKDFVLSGHGSISSAVDPVCPDAGGERGTANLEYTYGATQRVSSTNPCSGQRSTSARLQLEPAAPTAGTTTWTVTADLTMWAGKLARGEVSRVELAFLPAVGADQTAAIGTTNPAIAVGGAAKTISLAGTGAIVADADSYGKGIVSATKCNACHEALGTTFHSPNYGSAGVVGCRLCHTVNDGGSHLEMQSRSIDSYVHAIHSMQPFDVGSINFSDPVAAMHYEHHIESTYPSFSTLNCVSCHEGGTFEVPDQVRSLPSVLSASSTVAGRAISGIPSYVVGPASRACGSCHRAELINEDAMSTLVSFNAHTAAFGTLVVNGTGVLDAVTQDIMDQLGGPAFTGVAVAGTQVESCTICHATAGTQHQALFDSWRNDL